MVMPFFGFEVEPLGAQPLFKLGPLAITNTILTGVIVAVLLVIVLGVAAWASQLWPKSKLAFWVESLVELMRGMISDLFGDQKLADRYFPLLISLFLFILVSNLTGLLPGIQTLTYHHTSLLRA